VEQYVNNKDLNAHSGDPFSNSPTNETEMLIISDPITILLYSENCFWICIGEVNKIKINGNFVDSIPIEMLNEDSIMISY
jgi:hypothetical protein